MSPLKLGVLITVQIIIWALWGTREYLQPLHVPGQSTAAGMSAEICEDVQGGRIIAVPEEYDVGREEIRGQLSTGCRECWIPHCMKTWRYDGDGDVWDALTRAKVQTGGLNSPRPILGVQYVSVDQVSQLLREHLMEELQKMGTQLWPVHMGVVVLVVERCGMVCRTTGFLYTFVF